VRLRTATAYSCCTIIALLATGLTGDAALPGLIRQSPISQ